VLTVLEVLRMLLQSGTLSLRNSVPRMFTGPDTFRRHLKIHYFQQNAFLLAPHIRFLFTTARV